MFHSLMMLAVEANQVVCLRTMKLMLGGRRAQREAERMISEKVDAAFEASAIGSMVLPAFHGFEISWLTRTPPLILKGFYNPPNFATKLSIPLSKISS
jgi:hypothetical protein